VVSADLPYTYLAKGRYWRFRHRLFGERTLPGKPGEAEFHAAYAECMVLVEARASVKPASKDTFAWLIERYLKSAEFLALADTTQLDYGKTCTLLKEELGTVRFAHATRAMLKTVRDDHAATARKAHKIKQMLSRLYSWADENDLVPEGFNPAASIKRLKQKGGSKEYTVWSAAEFDTFIAAAIEPMQTAAMIARYTGQRVRDIGKMVWTDFQGEMIRVRQSKTGAPLMITCHASLRTYLEDLKRRLDADKKRGVLILSSVAGKAYNANSLSSAIGRDVKRIEGMPADRSLHGLRYMAGSDMEEAGCTVGEIEAVLGHQTFKMALKYASQRLRAKAAIAKMEAANNA
jgi:integrase